MKKGHRESRLAHLPEITNTNAPMPHLIAYAWLATIIVTIAVAAGRDIPILNAFGLINSRPGFCSSLVVLAIVCVLAAMQLYSESLLFGQQPMTWAMLIMLIYAWCCIGYQLRINKKQRQE